MRPTEIAKPLGVFVLVIAVVLAGTAVLSVVAGSGAAGTPDGEHIDGQSPGQFQPDAMNSERDPETGNITVDASEGEKRLLIDTAHNNDFSEEEIAPIVEALTAAGHEVDVGAAATGGGFGGADYNATLRQYDAVLVISPVSSFSEGERLALEKYTDGGGRLAVLGEPTQADVGEGSFGLVLAQISFGANGLTTQYGARMGADMIYNMDDSANDNNFKSVNSVQDGSSVLSEGVDTITFSRAGYIVPVADSGAEVLFTAADGTRALETDRTGTYATVVKNGNMIFVADSDFVTRSEIYDADNEVFISNLLEFMVSGDKPDDVPESPDGQGDDSGF